VQFAAVLACDGLKAGGNVLEAIIELTDFDQLGLAELAALGAIERFNPVGPGHAPTMRNNRGGRLSKLGHLRVGKGKTHERLRLK